MRRPFSKQWKLGRAESLVRWGRWLLERAPAFLPYPFIVLLAFALVPFFWTGLDGLLAGRESLMPLPIRSISLKSPVNTLENTDPFGSPPPSLDHGTGPQSVVASNLAFQLVGVAVLSNPHRSLAILKAGNIERVYGVGEVLPGGARIVSVRSGGVVLRYQGILQSISFTHSQQASASLPASVQTPSQAAGILFHPSQLLNYLRPLPVYSNGRFSGVRLYPGPNPSLFTRVGLQPGDILTAVNGVRLTNPLQSYNLIQHFAQEGVPIILNIQRNGTNLVISLPPTFGH
jgi:general secretion pathway protein C